MSDEIEPVAISRRLVVAWPLVLTRPARFFRTEVRHGDQAPGLIFAAGVVFLAVTIRLLLDPGSIPSIGQSPLIAAVLVIGLLVVLVTPVVLHLVAALLTIGLMVAAPNRGGISESVQLIGYATAPCVLVGFDIALLTTVATGYGTVLLIIGIAEIHRISWRRATVLGIIPALIVFGYGFGGVDAFMTLLRAWYII